MKNQKKLSREEIYLKRAKDVIKIYPSLEELCNHPLMDRIIGFSAGSISNKVDVLSKAVDKMCKEMYDLGFYKSTFFFPENDPFDFNTGKNIDGEALIYDSQGNTNKVNYLEFIALSKVLFCSFLGIELNDKQYKALDEFKMTAKISRILD